jgi:hypothetical protein
LFFHRNKSSFIKDTSPWLGLKRRASTSADIAAVIDFCARIVIATCHGSTTALKDEF